MTDLKTLLNEYAGAIVRYERLPHRQRTALGGDFVGDRSIERLSREDVEVARKAILTHESRVPSRKTLDEVAVGLATWMMLSQASGQKINPYAELLLTLLGIPIDAEWATSALETHHDTPAALVKALRDMAAMEGETAFCGQCDGPIERDGPSGEWEHVNTLALHKAKPKGETE